MGSELRDTARRFADRDAWSAGRAWFEALTAALALAGRGTSALER